MTTGPTIGAHPVADALVSIVIPCYGHADLLPEAIASVRQQTYQQVEIIVVDDGSLDDTAQVARRYPGVRLVRQPNRGLAAARNTGLEHACGTYVAFLDADDVLRPGAVEAGLAMFARRPDAGFVAGAHVRVDRARTPIDTPGRGVVCDDAFEMFLQGNSIGMHATVLYRRDVITAAGGFDPSLPACEDYDLYLRLSREVPVALHDTVVAEYRRHEGNMSNDSLWMLDQTLSVLCRQRHAARADPRYATAYRAGLRIWTNYYLNELARQPGRRSASVTSQLPRLARVARMAPRPVARRVARSLERRARRVAGERLPYRLRRLLRAGTHASPPIGRVSMGDLRRVRPISDRFGYDRGRPIDRYYIEGFLDTHREDIGGRVLEVGDASYTYRFGGDRVTRSDVLHVTADNDEATLVGDLADGDHLPSGVFDCIICTQTLHLVFDLMAGTATLLRMLAPGGVLLLTVPGITQVDRDEWGSTWCWSFTPYALHRLLRDAATDANIEVTGHGNVLAATAFLHGLADSELRLDELDHTDQAYPMLITARVERRS